MNLAIKFLIIFISCSFISCNIKQKKLEKIHELDQESRSSKNLKEWNKNAEILIKELKNYAKTYPGDSIAPSMLFKASEIELLMGDTNTALNTIQDIIINMPYIYEIPKVLFREAYIYDLKDDRAIALKKYQKIIEEYPDDIVAFKAKEAIKEINFSIHVLDTDTTR